MTFNRVSVVRFSCISSIWKEGNEKLFNNKAISIDNMVDFVKKSVRGIG